MIISRWRACASHGSFPLLVTSTQNWPSLTKPLPAPGAVNDVVHGMYLPPSKVVLLSSSLPDSFGASTPGEPLVGCAFQSGALPTLAEPGGTAAGAGVAGAVGVAAAGAPAAGAGGEEAQAASPHTTTNDGTKPRRRAGANANESRVMGILRLEGTGVAPAARP